MVENNSIGDDGARGWAVALQHSGSVGTLDLLLRQHHQRCRPTVCLSSGLMDMMKALVAEVRMLLLHLKSRTRRTDHFTDVYSFGRRPIRTLSFSFSIVVSFTSSHAHCAVLSLSLELNEWLLDTTADCMGPSRISFASMSNHW